MLTLSKWLSDSVTLITSRASCDAKNYTFRKYTFKNTLSENTLLEIHFRKMHFQKLHFQKIHFWKYTFRKYTIWKFFPISKTQNQKKVPLKQSKIPQKTSRNFSQNHQKKIIFSEGFQKKRGGPTFGKNSQIILYFCLSAYFTTSYDNWICFGATKFILNTFYLAPLHFLAIKATQH